MDDPRVSVNKEGFYEIKIDLSNPIGTMSTFLMNMKDMAEQAGYPQSEVLNRVRFLLRKCKHPEIVRWWQWWTIKFPNSNPGTLEDIEDHFMEKEAEGNRQDERSARVTASALGAEANGGLVIVGVAELAEGAMVALGTDCA